MTITDTRPEAFEAYQVDVENVRCFIVATAIGLQQFKSRYLCNEPPLHLPKSLLSEQVRQACKIVSRPCGLREWNFVTTMQL